MTSMTPGVVDAEFSANSLWEAFATVPVSIAHPWRTSTFI